jgi:hypothetical protein
MPGNVAVLVASSWKLAFYGSELTLSTCPADLKPLSPTFPNRNRRQVRPWDTRAGVTLPLVDGLHNDEMFGTRGPKL